MIESKDNREFVTVFSQRLAGTLMAQGYVLAAMKPKNDNSGRNVFFFYDSPQIQKAIRRYGKK